MKFSAITLILILTLTQACKEDPIPDPVFFTIKANKTVMIADGIDIITLTAKDKYNEDITAECEFFVNSNLITGNTFTTAVAGLNVFSASYKNVKSNHLNIEARNKYSFSIDKTTILADGIDKAVISVVNWLGQRKSDQALFTIDNVPITGNAFSSSSAGVYTMKAEIEGYSYTKVVTAASSVKFTGRVLIEDFTGAWCGYCPRMTTAIDQARAANSNILAIAVHNGDIMATPYEKALRGQYGINSFPNALINRTSIWDEKASTLLQFLQTDVNIGVALSTTLIGNLASAEVNLKFNSAPTSPIKVAVYILEDNIIREQANFYPDGRGNPIPNFNHSAVLREKMSIEFMGDAVNTSGVTAGSLITLNFSKTLSAAWVADNCKVIAVVVKSSSDQVITAQETILGKSVGY